MTKPQKSRGPKAKATRSPVAQGTAKAARPAPKAAPQGAPKEAAAGVGALRAAAWLLKSEPEVFSFQDLMEAPDRRTGWDGVRNYQARNFMRDSMQVGDLVLFYHSNSEPPGLAGLARVACRAYPDPTQFDPRDPHFDPTSDPADPRWLQVDVRAEAPLDRFLSLQELRAEPRLEGLLLLAKGSRLSVQPVSAAHLAVIHELAGVAPRAARAPLRGARSKPQPGTRTDSGGPGGGPRARKNLD